jgi:hypothetical protein
MAEATSFQFLFGQLRDAETSLAGGTVYFYAIGGTTPKAVYTDISATSTIYSIVLDADGSAEVYGIGQYRVLVQDSEGVTQYDKDITLRLPLQIPTITFQRGMVQMLEHYRTDILLLPR